MQILLKMACLVPLALGEVAPGQEAAQEPEETVRYGKCSIDLGVPMLPPCALETRNGQLFVLPKFAEDVFAGRVHGLAAKPVKVGRERLASIFLDEGKWSYFDPNGLVVVQNVAAAENAPWPFQDGLVPVTKAGKWGLADAKGKLAVPLEYDGLTGNWKGRGWLVCTGCRVVQKEEHSWFSGGKWVRLDKRGRVAGTAKDPTAGWNNP